MTRDGAGTAGKVARLAGRLLLGGVLLVAGVAHFAALDAFLGQVPTFAPARATIVYGSGLVELTLGVSLIVLSGRRLAIVGWIVAIFFVAVFPGNLWQAYHGSDSFGLDTERSRLLRLPFQPLLVLWALWCSGAWRAWRRGELRRG